MPSRRAVRALVAVTATTALMSGVAACGRSSSSTATAAAVRADGTVDPARCTGTTTGVTKDAITFGLSHPESGPTASNGKISIGIQAYFDYINAEQGGVKGHKLKLVTKDDAGQTSRTVANVNDLLDKDKVFGFIQNTGTANNLAIRDRLDHQCVPNLLTSNGSPKLVDPTNHPFTMIANVPQSDEAAAFVDYLAAKKPGAKLAVLTENSDFGRSYLDALNRAVVGKNLTIVAKQTYETTDANLAPQFTALGSAGANALFIGALSTKCPQALDAAAGKGFSAIYLNAVCNSKAIIGLAKPANTEGVISENASMEPTNPAVANDPRVKLYLTKVKQYQPKADLKNNLISYGWTQAAVLVEILKASPALDRVAVINTARNLTLTDHPGLFQDGVVWKTAGVADPYPVESFRLQTWNSKGGYYVPMGGLVSYEGRSGTLSR